MEYKVLSNVQHDGTFYPHGTTINLDGETADSLLAQGVIAELDKAENLDPNISLNDAYEMLLSDLKNSSITQENAYTKSGKPNCEMLAMYAKREISGKERNEWWSKHSANPDNEAKNLGGEEKD